MAGRPEKRQAATNVVKLPRFDIERSPSGDGTWFVRDRQTGMGVEFGGVVLDTLDIQDADEMAEAMNILDESGKLILVEE